MSKNLKTQELENDQQTSFISKQGEEISQQEEEINRLQEAQFTIDRKYKPEVHETRNVFLYLHKMYLLSSLALKFLN